jgi:hypothetical protein
MSTEGQLLEFHNRYTRALAARAAVWLSLRAATELSLRASIDERFDPCIELSEKASAGRIGTLPAVVCDALRAALVNYRTHCAALYERLKTFGWSGEVMQWLDAVKDRDDVPLLCTIHGAKHLKPASTHDLKTHVPGVSDLAADWGRKFAENFLRKAGAQSRDIDRHQRHDVRGQEQDASVADGSEAEWVRRLKPALDAMSRALFVARLNGLHKGAQAK